MKVAIVSIGDELMNGFTVDTNSSWIAMKVLEYKSLDVVSKITVKDDADDIKNNLDYLFEKNEPAAFHNPIMAKMSDWIMFKDIILGRLKIW